MILNLLICKINVLDWYIAMQQSYIKNVIISFNY